MRGGVSGYITTGIAADSTGLLTANMQWENDMCLTCGCMQAHLEMGSKNIRYEDVKAAADENGKSVAETLDIIQRTLDIDRGDHAAEYAP